MQNEKPRLAIDMDEVIADAHTGHADWYSKTYGYEWSSLDLKGFPLQSAVSRDHAEAMEAVLHQGDIFGTFGVMPGSQAALKSLMERFDIFVTTAAMEYPASCAPKYAWLREHFPFISPLNIVFCGNKSILAADILIDNNARHFARFQGQGVLFSAPHNQSVNRPFRVDSWTRRSRFLINGQLVRHRRGGDGSSPYQGGEPQQLVSMGVRMIARDRVADRSGEQRPRPLIGRQMQTTFLDITQPGHEAIAEERHQPKQVAGCAARVGAMLLDR